MQRPSKDSISPWWIILLLLSYFAMAVWMSVRLPALATPNELLNFEYIQVMRQIGGLPNRGLVDSEVRYTEWHQPPLYFTFAALAGLPVPVPPSDTNPPAPIEWPSNPAYLATHRGNLNPVVHVTPENTPLLYTSRIAATLLGVLGVSGLYRAGRCAYGTAVALLMASLLAFQPNYIHLSGSVNNDMPLTAVAALVLSYTILLLYNDKQPRAFLGLGLLAAAAILTKANGVFVLAYLGAAWLAVLLRHHNWARAGKSILFTLAGLVPLWGSWLLLNTIRMRDTLGVEGSLPVGRVLALQPRDFALLAPWLDNIWRSFWLDWSAGDTGYGPDWFYLLWSALLLVGLLGWLRPSSEHRQRLLALVVLLGAAAISYLYFAVKALTVKEAGYLVPEGRWWLPIMPGLAWLAAVGYSHWWQGAQQNRALLLAALVPAGSTLLLLVLHLPALYPQAQPVSSTAVDAQQNATIYDSALALSTGEVKPLTAGADTRIDLTYQVLQDIDRDYTIAAQLLVPYKGGWQKLDEQNSYPGYGRSPTAGWRAGEAYRDSITLHPLAAPEGPTLAQVVIQVQENGRNLPAGQGGTVVDPPVLLTTSVRPASPMAIGAPLDQPVEYGGILALRGATTVEEGDDLLVSLWWESLKETPANYTIFAHVLDKEGALQAQDDSLPASGSSPTTIWRAGDIVRDVHRVPGGATGASVLVGVYDGQTGERLQAQQAGRLLPDQVLRLEVEP